MLSEKEKKLIQSGIENWHIRPYKYYKKFLSKKEWMEYQKKLYPFMMHVVGTKSMTKEQAKWEMLWVFLHKKIKGGQK